jgi:hypothetical protein
MEGDSGHARVGGQPAGKRHALAAARLEARAQLDRDRQSAALVRGAGEGHGAVLVLEQRRSGARLHHLANRTAHVEVDQVGARIGHHRGGLAHHVRIVSEELHGHRVLVRVDAQELADRPLVAVGETEARDHLGDHEAGPEALGLKTHEPVAYAGQGGEHHAVGDLCAAEGPGGGEGAHGCVVTVAP